MLVLCYVVVVNDFNLHFLAKYKYCSGIMSRMKRTRPVTAQMFDYCKEACNQLYAIIKTKAPKEKVILMLKKYFEEKTANIEHKYK